MKISTRSAFFDPNDNPVDFSGNLCCNEQELLWAIAHRQMEVHDMVPESGQGDFEETHPFKVLAPGTLISHYRIMEKIGEGGMGVVYRAIDTKLDRPVALKFLPPCLLTDVEARARFEHEAKSASAISHANIATIHEIDEAEGQCFISMEYIEGRSIKDLSQGKPLSVGEILAVAIQIGSGLKAAHHRGVIHRDIKSANILVSSDGVAKITDFGLAKLRGATKLTKTGTTLGTLHYMSPEQAQGKDVDARSDLFSFGVVLYEMITGQLPFKGEYDQAVVHSILNDTPEPLARYKAGLPEGLQRIVDKALAKDRDERYQDADDLLADLKHEKRLLETGGLGPIAPEVTRKSRNRILRVVIPAAVAVAAAIVIFIFEPFRVEMGPQKEAAARENFLAIMYFENLADREDPKKLGEIITNLLITDLSESRYVSVVSGQRLYDILKQLGKESVKVVNKEVASEVAGRAHARLMLLGSILRVDPQVTITAQLVEVDSGRVRASERVTGGPGEEIFALVDRLASEVRDDLSLPAAAREELVRPVADVTTHSSEAYRHYLEGMDYFYKYSFPEAERSFEKALEYDSTFAMAYYGLACATEEVKRSKEMIAKAVEYSGKVSENERHYIRARAAFLSDNYTQAMEELQELLKHDPDDKIALERLADVYAGLLRYDDAITCLTKIIELDPLHKAAYNTLAYLYESIGDFDRSIWAADKYISLAPDEHNPYDTRGDIYAWNGRIDQAIGSYKQALERKPDYYISISKLGSMYLFKREYARAESCYQKLCTSTDKHTRSEGRSRLAYVAMYRGRLEEAMHILDAGIMADQMEQTTFWLLDKHWSKSAVFLEKNQPGDALKEYEEEMAICRRFYPEDLGSMNAGYARLLAINHEIDRAGAAVKALKEYLEKKGDPEDNAYWYAAGWFEIAKGNLNEALADFEKAASATPYLPYRYALARTYLESGRWGEAVPVLENLLSRYDEIRAEYPFESVKAYYLLGLAYEESGWHKKAMDLYDEFLETWKDADPGLPEIEDARQRLARLRQGS
jgi:tetratricopeptide (TPR) repeat protein/predicted Ser/Thr protein kinase